VLCLRPRMPLSAHTHTPHSSRRTSSTHTSELNLMACAQAPSASYASCRPGSVYNLPWFAFKSLTQKVDPHISSYHTALRRFETTTGALSSSSRSKGQAKAAGEGA
jgi:hypothetical protein